MRCGVRRVTRPRLPTDVYNALELDTLLEGVSRANQDASDRVRSAAADAHGRQPSGRGTPTHVVMCRGAKTHVTCASGAAGDGSRGITERYVNEAVVVHLADNEGEACVVEIPHKATAVPEQPRRPRRKGAHGHRGWLRGGFQRDQLVSSPSAVSPSWLSAGARACAGVTRRRRGPWYGGGQWNARARTRRRLRQKPRGGFPSKAKSLPSSGCGRWPSTRSPCSGASAWCSGAATNARWCSPAKRPRASTRKSFATAPFTCCATSRAATACSATARGSTPRTVHAAGLGWVVRPI